MPVKCSQRSVGRSRLDPGEHLQRPIARSLQSSVWSIPPVLGNREGIEEINVAIQNVRSGRGTVFHVKPILDIENCPRARTSYSVFRYRTGSAVGPRRSWTEGRPPLRVRTAGERNADARLSGPLPVPGRGRAIRPRGYSTLRWSLVPRLLGVATGGPAENRRGTAESAGSKAHQPLPFHVKHRRCGPLLNMISTGARQSRGMQRSQSR